MADYAETEAARPGAERSSGRSASAAGLYWLLAAIVLVAWSCFSFPQVTLTPQSLDYSWQAVLIYAHETGMQFGRDLVFTYGPLGFLSIECFSPYSPVARMCFEVAFGFGIATGLCLLAWRMALPWRLVLLGFFVFVAAPLHWDGDALYVNIGLFAWGLPCFLESGARLRVFVSILVALAAVGALVKFTFLITGVFTVGLLACDLVLRRRFALAAGTVIGYGLAFLLGWMLLGQSPSGLGRYLVTSFAIANGYNRAMGLNSINVAWVLIMTLAALGAVTIRVVAFAIAGREPRLLGRGPLLFWLAGLLFEEWKYSCVRSDWDHVAMMLGFMPIVAIGMEALPVAGRKVVFWSRAAGLLSITAAFMFIQSEVGGWALARCVQRSCLDLSVNLGILARPTLYLREQTDAFRAEQLRDQLPEICRTTGRAPTDIFGQGQVFALFNELDYRPRPVFQSYTAYSRPLMELNDQFYLSKDAPEYVLFNLHPLDGRFPPLEDAFVLRELLTNFELVSSEADFLLLRRKTTTKVQLILVREGTARTGEKIILPDQSDESLWLEIEFQPSLFDRLREFLYKPPETQLTIWSPSDRASPFKFRAPAAMLSAGFLANPLVLDDQDVRNIYTGANLRRAGAFSVELAPDPLNFSQPQIHFRVYRIQK